MLAEKQDFAINSGDPTKVCELLAKANTAEAAFRTQGADGEKQQTRAIASEARTARPESPQLASVSVSSPAVEIQSLLPTDETLIEFY